MGYLSWVIGYSQEPKTHDGLENWTQNPRWVGLGSGWVRVLMGPAEVYQVLFVSYPRHLTRYSSP
jgi:hypothetical protein